MYNVIYHRKYYQIHKDRISKRTSTYSKEHPEIIRKTHLNGRYGISIDDYEMILKQQKGRCAICRKKPARWRLDVDHDHHTDKVRGLLCRACNTKIDWFHKYFSVAREYLQK